VRPIREATVVARTVVRVVVPIIVATALALLFQGHNQPGGGFIGGVLTVTAFVLVYVVFGLDFLRDVVLDVDAEPVEGYRWLFAGGLGLAIIAGIAPLVWGRAFLSQGVLFLSGLPLYGTLEVASALAFDLGVYGVVVGALLAIVAEVGAE